VINIASIHAGLTKPGFSAYSTSKSGLVGLTRSLAVELGAKVRVNAISPAAIDTPMLRDGFSENLAGLAELERIHPGGIIGTPTEVAELAFFMARNESKFLNGSIVGLDGGISGRLHDPI
jgi:NAD(P)-dependent dehydrogenase (short-subunit alcohol dehydrogenase family)